MYTEKIYNMLVVSNSPIKCDKCQRMFNPGIVQGGQYHCERCGRTYILCPSCAKNAKCACGASLNDAWTIDGTRILF